MAILSWQQTTLALSCAVAFISTTTTTVDAHGYISSPKAQFILPENYTNYDFLLEAKSAGVPLWNSKKWNSSPEKNVAQFTELFKNQTTYKTLKDFADTFVPNCANTRIDVPPVDVSAMTELKYQNDEKKMGIVDTHHGPCEIWINETRTFRADDCRAYTTAYPAVFPIDYSVCKDDCIITYYWLALHEPTWQIYKQCVPINNPLGVGPPSQLVTTSSSSPSPASASSGSHAGSGSSVGSTKPSSVVGGDADTKTSTVPAPAPATTSSAAVSTAMSLALCMFATALAGVAA